MKLQVVGASGMLGRVVLSAAQAAGHEPIGSFYGDITTCAVLGQVVINCAGIVKQRVALDSEFVMVNGFGPQRLAEACDGIGSRLIQVSTDCVFAGPGPHSESDTPDAQGIYAVSKLAGEVTRAPHLTIRTSFVGFGKRGLIHDLSQPGQVLAGNKLMWSGHTVPTIARLLVELASRPDITGLLHVPGEFQSRFELAARLKDQLGLQAEIRPADDMRIDRRLKSERWNGLGLSELPLFRQQMAGLK
jgi:dTDP-4-dehydrorhamnose reductase